MAEFVACYGSVTHFDLSRVARWWSRRPARPAGVWQADSQQGVAFWRLVRQGSAPVGGGGSLC